MRGLVPSPAMGVAFAALVLAVGGVAIAATDDFVSPDGDVKACIAKDDIVKQLSQVVSGITTAVSPKGAMRAVAPGQSCAQGEAEVVFSVAAAAAPAAPAAAQSSLPMVLATQSTDTEKVGSKMEPVAGKTLPSGSFLVNGTAEFVAAAGQKVDEIVTCAFVDAAGKVIESSKRSETLVADTNAERLSMALSALLVDLPAGKLTIKCSAVPVGGSGAASARAAQLAPNDRRQPAKGRKESAAEKKAREQYERSEAPTTKATFTAQQTQNTTKPKTGDTRGCPADSFCVWAERQFKGEMRAIKVDYDQPGHCYKVDRTDGFRSIVNNTSRPIATYETTYVERCELGDALSTATWTSTTRSYRPIDTVAPGGSVPNSHDGSKLGFYAVGLSRG